MGLEKVTVQKTLCLLVLPEGIVVILLVSYRFHSSSDGLDSCTCIYSFFQILCRYEFKSRYMRF